ncbi:MAG: hypothetical protein WBC74_00380 [Candidatus Omnitrophota bacterium]
MKRLVVLLLLVFLCGCSAMQIRQIFLGMSAEDVENSEKKYAKTLDLDAAYCYKTALKSVKDMQARTIHEKPEEYFIVANRFDKAYTLCIDTTELGILIVPLEDDKSRIEVASGNYSLARFVSEELFRKLQEQEKLHKEGKR